MTRQRYVVAVDHVDGVEHIDAWGPFDSDTDRSAFVIELANDNGWTQIETVSGTEEEIRARTTDHDIHSPYKKI